MNDTQKYNFHIAEYMDYEHYGLTQGNRTYQYNLQAYTLDEMEYATSWDWLMPVVDTITRNEGGNYRKTIETLRQTLVDNNADDNVFNTLPLMHKAVGLYCELHQDYSDEVKIMARDFTKATFLDLFESVGDRALTDFSKPKKFYQAACLKYSKLITL